MSSTKRSRSADDAGGRKRKPVALARDSDTVLAKTRELREKLRAKNSAEKVVPEEVPSDIVEVAELSATEVLEGIEGIAVSIAKQVLAKKGFSLDIPSRAASNQIYVKEWDRIVLGGKRSARSFTNVKVSFYNLCAGSVLRMEKYRYLKTDFLQISMFSGISQERDYTSCYAVTTCCFG